MISKHYRVDKTNLGILGISNGALFATYVLFTKPDAFNNYILGNPRFDRDNFVALKYEEEYFVKTDSLSANLFLSAGSEDSENWVEESTTARTHGIVLNNGRKAGYAYQWWTDEQVTEESNIFTAYGYGDQYLIPLCPIEPNLISEIKYLKNQMVERLK